MNTLARITGFATRREANILLLSNFRDNAPRAARTRKTLACRWIRDPESGRLVCVWGPDEVAQDAEPTRGFQLAA